VKQNKNTKTLHNCALFRQSLFCPTKIYANRHKKVFGVLFISGFICIDNYALKLNRIGINET